MNAPLEEPSIPEKLKWPLAALWISLGLHGALIALVQIAPPPPTVEGGVIEARLVPVAPPRELARLTPNIETDETIAVDAQDRDKTVDPVKAPDASPQPVQMPSPAAPSALEIPIAVDLNYYEARELDQTPRGHIPDPVFPESVSGRIRFQLKIEESGQVSEVEVLEAGPPEKVNRATLEIAREALRATRFTPGIKNGRPVRARVIYELTIAPATAP